MKTKATKAGWLRSMELCFRTELAWRWGLLGASPEYARRFERSMERRLRLEEIWSREAH